MNQHLAEVLMPITVMGTFGAGLYYFTKVMTNYILKKKMIDKGYVNEDAQALFRESAANENKTASLKWGLITLFGGLSLVIMEYLPTGPDSPLPYGVFAVFVSLGFLIYYFMVREKK